MKIIIISLFSVLPLLSACGKAENPKLAEARKQMMAGVDELASEFAMAYPKHDKKYYKEKIEIFVEGCINKDDISTCLNGKLDSLRK